MAYPAPHLLFPCLPPELRNEVYTHLQTLTPSTAGIPLPLKTHTCAHTTVSISAVHHGCPSLLSLPVLEAREYAAHLLSQVELRIGIVFKGRGQTFVQKHWDEKVGAWLRKLVRKYRWLGKVGRFEVRVAWNAKDGVLRSKGGKRTVGGIVKRMVDTVTSFGEGSRRNMAGLKVCLRIENWVAVDCARSGLSLGLREFFAEDGRWETHRREVWVEARKAKSEETDSGRLVPVPPVEKEEKTLFVVEGKSVDWASLEDASLVMKKDIERGSAVEITLGDKSVEGDAGADFALRALAEDCMARA